MRKWTCLLAGALLLSGSLAAAEGATALIGQQSVTIAKTLPDPTGLWVSPEDLSRINGFVYKPEGLCYEDICIPVRPGDDSLAVERAGQTWVNVTELARKLGQSVVSDPEAGVWSFGPMPATTQSGLVSAQAPDFELADRDGKTIRLSDYRGKKVLLLTWASW